MEMVSLTQTDANDDTTIADEEAGAGGAVSCAPSGSPVATGPDPSPFHIANVTDSLGTTTGVWLTAVQMANGDVLVLDWADALGDTKISADELTSVAASDMTGYLSSLDIQNSSIAVCFVPETRIRTDLGSRPIRTLHPGTRVAMLVYGYQPGRRAVRARFSASDPGLAPIEIRAGVLGPDTPRRPRVVPASHRVLLRTALAAHLCARGEVLIAAKPLLALPGVHRLPVEPGRRFWHPAFERHEVVLAEDCPAESLCPGGPGVLELVTGQPAWRGAYHPRLRAHPRPAARPPHTGAP